MLGPDEQFTQLSLSGGKPKKPNVIKALCLLLGPDFCTDIIVVETADHARLSLQLSYNWWVLANINFYKIINNLSLGQYFKNKFPNSFHALLVGDLLRRYVMLIRMLYYICFKKPCQSCIFLQYSWVQSIFNIRLKTLVSNDGREQVVHGNVFAHGAMGHRVDSSWWTHWAISYPSVLDWCKKKAIVWYPDWDGAYKRTLTANRKE